MGVLISVKYQAWIYDTLSVFRINPYALVLVAATTSPLLRESTKQPTCHCIASLLQRKPFRT
jgi:hypothetical protein